MGVEAAQPVINEKCLAEFHQRRGRRWHYSAIEEHLRIVAGAGVPAGLERAGHDILWEDLTRQAAEAPPLVAFINPDDPRFLAPANMPDTIRQYCGETGQMSRKAKARSFAVRWKASRLSTVRCLAGWRS